MHELLRKFRDVALSVLLIVIFVLIINVTVIHIEWKYIWEFLLGALLVYIGLSVFLLGVDIGISPIGHHMGKVMTRSNKKWIVATGSLILGFIVSLAEPSLMILGQQVETVTSGKIDNYLLIVVVSIGIGTLVSIAAMRIITGFSIKTLFFILYGIILILSFFVSNEFLAITFDASGATTGSLTVPFLLALTVGIAVIKTKQGSAEEDSFGLLGIASAGAIISTLVLGLFINTHNLDGGGVITHEDVSFFPVLLTQLKNVAIAMIPIVVVFIAAHLAVGFTISTVARNQLQAMQMAFFFFLPSLMLSGFMFPFRGMPDWAQAIGEVLPLTHFLRIVRGIMLKGNGAAEVAPEVWPIVAFLIAVSAVALKRYRLTLD